MQINRTNTVKLGDKERFDNEQISRDQFSNLLHTDKEHLALRNNFRVTKKYLITKFDNDKKNIPKEIKKISCFF